MGSWSIPGGPKEAGQVNDFFKKDLTYGNQRVIDGHTSGKEWYGIIDDGKRRFAAVILFWWSGGEFWIKPMSENEGPFYYNCPVRFLELLTPPINDMSAEWRNKVLIKHGKEPIYGPVKSKSRRSRS